MADKANTVATEKAGDTTVGEAESAKLVKVKAIRSFQGVEGFKNPVSDPFEVSEQRAKDMLEAGLVEVVTDEKPAP